LEEEEEEEENVDSWDELCVRRPRSLLPPPSSPAPAAPAPAAPAPAAPAPATLAPAAAASPPFPPTPFPLPFRPLPFLPSERSLWEVDTRDILLLELSLWMSCAFINACGGRAGEGERGGEGGRGGEGKRRGRVNPINLVSALFFAHFPRRPQTASGGFGGRHADMGTRLG
jgi:hypothetical protein